LQYFTALAALGACAGQAVVFVNGLRKGPRSVEGTALAPGSSPGD